MGGTETEPVEAEAREIEAEGDPRDPETWGWTGELAPNDLTAMGPVSLHLLLRGAAWVNRRVETVDLIDETRVRHQISVDFRLPERLPGAVSLGGEPTYMLPLTLLPRNSELAYFDVRDQDGTALPILTRQENARLTGMVLVAAARRAVRLAASGVGDETLSNGLETYLAAIPTMPSWEARRLAREVLDPSSDLLYANSPEIAAAVLDDDDFRDLLGICQSCSIIHVPLVAKRGQRRIVKIAWEARWVTEPSSRTDVGRVNHVKRAWRAGKRLWRGLQGWVGWRSHVLFLMTPNVGAAESYHVQIAVPEDVELTEAGMANAPSRTLLEKPKPPGDGEEDPYEPSHTGVTSRVHLYIQRSHQHRAGLVWVGLRASRHGLLRAAVFTGVLITTVLSIFALRADEIIGQSETAAAVLLLAPALLAGFLVRPGEHAMARDILRGPRLLTSCLGVLPLAAAGLLVVGGEHRRSGVLRVLFGEDDGATDLLATLWTGLAVFAGFLTVLLLFSLLRPRPGRHVKVVRPDALDAPFGDGSR